MTIKLPDNVKLITETLYNAGFESYAVGGCVRDSLLGRQPNDWDITTSAKPEEVKKLFRRTVDTGIKHGTVTVLIGSEGYEVTTYRVDGEYLDGRHPENVEFTSSLREDLRRRDFTVNAMAYNERDGLVDIFGGIDDLNNKIIRCVGNPRERFSEDALRLLRAIRFAAQLGYTIEEETYKAISELSPTLAKVSAERIQVELVKTLTSPHPELIKTAYETGLTKTFIPELDACFECEQNNPHHMYNVGDHIIHSVMNSRNDKRIRLAMLLHDICKPECKETDENGIDHFHGHPAKSAEKAQEILRRLKFDNETIGIVVKYVRYHDLRIVNGTKYLRRAVSKVGEGVFPEIFDIMRADLSAQSTYMAEEKLAALEANIRNYEEITAKEQCMFIRQLSVSGKDLIASGIEPGPRIGVILDALLEDVVENPEHNNKEYLMSKAKQL